VCPVGLFVFYLILADGGPEDVSIVFAPQAPGLQILHRVESMHRGKSAISIENRVDISFPEEESYYQLNNLEKIPFQVHVMEYNKILPSSPPFALTRVRRRGRLIPNYSKVGVPRARCRENPSRPELWGKGVSYLY
jgi:hypothetical protein